MLKDFIRNAEKMAAAAFLKTGLQSHMPIGRASMLVTHKRPTDFIKDAATGQMIPDPRSFKLVDEPELVYNLITNAGRDYLHLQGYQTTGLGTNGLNYIALSNDTVTETVSSTVLSTEITTNGLGRAQGTVAHTAGTNTTTVDKTFTATGTQSAQKAALFTAVSAGTMNHVLGFTQRALISGDTLQVTFTITLG